MEFKQLLLLLILCNFMLFEEKIKLDTKQQSCKFIVTFDYKITNSTIEQEMKEYQIETRKDLNDLNKKKLKDYIIDKDSFKFKKNCYQYKIEQKIEDNNGKDDNIVTLDLTLELTFNEKGGNNKLTFVVPVVPDNTNNTTIIKDNLVQGLLDKIQQPQDNGQIMYNSGSEKKVLLVGDEKLKINQTEVQLAEDCTDLNDSKDEDNLDWINCVPNDIELHNFWYNSITSNWAFWLWVFILMSFFLVSVFLDEEMDPTFNKEEPWTHHPVYSIRHCITAMFWKRQRLALLYVEICGMCLVLSLLTWKQSDEPLVLQIVVFPLCACILAFIPSFIAGLLLRRYINTFRVYIDEYRSNENLEYEQRNRMLDKFHSTNYRTILVFYTYCALFCIGCNVAAIITLRYKSFSDMWWYILQVTLGVLWNLLFFNVLFVIMAKGSEGLHNFLLNRGYYYEKELNDNYREYFKIE